MEKVTCIMPTTAARKSFVPLAIDYFLRQDYKDATLMIVDDSDGSIEALLPQKPEIRYLHYANRFSSVGAKRNAACAAAAGNIIMHWDDDDWYAPDWISRQVMALSAGDISGLDKLHFYDPQRQRSWQYHYRLDNRPWVAGATLAYHRKVWERNPFRDINVGEDNQFVWHSGAKVIRLDYAEGFVSLLHPGNTSPKYTDNWQWKPVPVETVRAFMGKDAQHYDCHQEPQ